MKGKRQELIDAFSKFVKNKRMILYREMTLNELLIQFEEDFEREKEKKARKKNFVIESVVSPMRKPDEELAQKQVLMNRFKANKFGSWNKKSNLYLTKVKGGWGYCYNVYCAYDVVICVYGLKISQLDYINGGRKYEHDLNSYLGLHSKVANMRMIY